MTQISTLATAAVAPTPTSQSSSSGVSLQKLAELTAVVEQLEQQTSDTLDEVKSDGGLNSAMVAQLAAQTATLNSSTMMAASAIHAVSDNVKQVAQAMAS